LNKQGILFPFINIKMIKEKMLFVPFRLVLILNSICLSEIWIIMIKKIIKIYVLLSRELQKESLIDAQKFLLMEGKNYLTISKKEK
jgi:hypothetical protein